MSSDVILHDEQVEVQGDERVTLRTRLVIAEALDIHLNHPARRSAEGASRWRRALVHAPGDQLAINFNGDYPGGVLVNGPTTFQGGVRFAATPTMPDVMLQGLPSAEFMGGRDPRTRFRFRVSEPRSLVETLEEIAKEIDALEARLAKLER